MNSIYSEVQVEELKASTLQAMTKNRAPIKLTFTDLKYTVRVENKEKNTKSRYRDEVILKSASGYMLPGQTHYIMGASGAGKTTLLNALSGRIKVDSNCRLTGERLLNDCVPLNTSSFSRFGAYVMQDDMLFEYFTVREALEFAAKLKLAVGPEKIRDRIEDIIEELGLHKC